MPRRHKYGAVPKVVEGIRFASTKEATRYQELRLLERAGEICQLELQPVFPLYSNLTTGTLNGAARAMAGEWPKVGEYRADFAYFDERTCERVIEDVKGLDTPLSKWKRRHVRAQYGVDVQIV